MKWKTKAKESLITLRLLCFSLMLYLSLSATLSFNISFFLSVCCRCATRWWGPRLGSCDREAWLVGLRRGSLMGATVLATVVYSTGLTLVRLFYNIYGFDNCFEFCLDLIWDWVWGKVIHIWFWVGHVMLKAWWQSFLKEMFLLVGLRFMGWNDKKLGLGYQSWSIKCFLCSLKMWNVVLVIKLVLF